MRWVAVNIRTFLLADISRISSTVGGDVVFMVTVDLDTQPDGLLWGMSADVQIETGQ